MDALRRIYAKIAQQLGALGTTHKLLIGSLAVIAVMTLFLVSRYASRGTLVEFMPAATASERATASTYLRTVGISTVERGGVTMISAEAERHALAALAEQRLLPADATLLFDNLIDRQSWTMPRNQLDTYYTIAKQNELARVIERFPTIRRAQVMVEIPEQRGLGMTYRRGTGQVTVFTAGDAELPQKTVDALAELVARSFSGLDLEMVSVINGSTGRNRKPSSPDEFGASSYLEVLAQTERYIRDKLEAHLAYIPNVMVSVNAVVDTARREQQTTAYLPRGEGTEQLVSREDSSTQQMSSGELAGEPGVRSNTGMDVNRGSSGRGGSSTERTETAFESRFGVRNTVERTSPGEVRRIYASVSVPRDYVAQLASQSAGNGGGGGEENSGPSQEAVEAAFESERRRLTEDLSLLVATAAAEAGAPAGDIPQVRVSMIPVPMAMLGAGGFGGAGGVGGAGGGGGFVGTLNQLAAGGILQQALLGILALVAIGMMALMVRRATKMPELPSAEELAGVPPALISNDDLVGEADESEAAMAGIEIRDDKVRVKKMLAEVDELVRTTPDKAATIFTRWVTAEE